MRALRNLGRSVPALFARRFHEGHPLSRGDRNVALRWRCDDLVVRPVGLNPDISATCLAAAGLHRKALLFALSHPLARHRLRQVAFPESLTFALRSFSYFGNFRSGDQQFLVH